MLIAIIAEGREDVCHDEGENDEAEDFEVGCRLCRCAWIGCGSLAGVHCATAKGVEWLRLDADMLIAILTAIENE